MKKYSVLLLVVMVITSASFAQSFKFGPKLGANLGKIEGKGFSDAYTIGYHVGGFTEIGLGKKFGIQAEVLFNQINGDTVSGFKAIYQNIDQQNFSDPQLNYLSIPLLLTFKPVKIVTLQLGPQFGILMDNNKNLIQNGKDAFKKGNISMLAGAQLNILRVRVYGRYAVGLSNINDIDDQEKWTTTGFQVGVGFAF